MTTVIVGMLIALLLAVAVVALVAIPAHREGRDLLSPEGEQLVANAREKVVDLAERLPTPSRDNSPTSNSPTSNGATSNGPTGAAAAPAPTAGPQQPDVDLRPARHGADHRTD